MVLVRYYYNCTIFYSKCYHNEVAMQCCDHDHGYYLWSEASVLFRGSCVPSLIPHCHFPWFFSSSYLNLILRKMIFSPSEKPKISVSLLLLIYIILTYYIYTSKSFFTLNFSHHCYHKSHASAILYHFKCFLWKLVVFSWTRKKI